MKNVKILIVLTIFSIVISSTNVSSLSVLTSVKEKIGINSENHDRLPIFERIFALFRNPLIPFPEIKPAIGNYPLLLILIEFDGVPHYPSHDIHYFDDMLFGEYPSVNDYYNEVSYGKLSFEKAEILGWYTSRCELKGSGARDEIVREAFIKASNDKSINYKQYDKNSDGILTADELDIVVCTSGITDKAPFGAYHNWKLKGIRIRTWDGMIFSGDHSVVQEWQEWMICAHELGHSFYLTDLYDYTKKSEGIGSYGLMGSGNIDYTNGHHFTAWSKIKLGWIEPKIITEDGFYIVNDSETNPEAYILMDKSHSEKEYFLVENRFRGDTYDNRTGNPLPDQGILIYHIDESVPRWITPWTWFPWVNNIERHKMVDIECADSFSSHFANADDLDKKINRGDSGDLWDNSTYGFNSTSYPCNSRWYDGSSNKFGVYVLSEPSESMLVYFSVNGTTPWGDSY